MIKRTLLQKTVRVQISVPYQNGETKAFWIEVPVIMLFDSKRFQEAVEDLRQWLLSEQPPVSGEEIMGAFGYDV